MVRFGELFSVEDWQRVTSQAEEFVHETESRLDELRQRKGKNFLVRKHDYGRENRLMVPI